MRKEIIVILLVFTAFGCWKYNRMKIDKEIAEFDCRMKLLKAPQNTPPKRDEL